MVKKAEEQVRAAVCAEGIEPFQRRRNTQFVEPNQTDRT